MDPPHRKVASNPWGGLFLIFLQNNSKRTCFLKASGGPVRISSAWGQACRGGAGVLKVLGAQPHFIDNCYPREVRNCGFVRGG